VTGRRGSKVLRGLAWTAAAAVVLALVLAALVAFVVPGVVKTQAAKGMEEATGRKLAIGGLSINPFTLFVEIRDLSLSEKGGEGTFASLKRAQVRVSHWSLLKGTPLLSDIRLEEPHFQVVRLAPNTYNFSDLVKYLMMPVPALSIADAAATGGTIDFVDRALPKEERHRLTEAELIVPFLTTVPARAAEYGNPRFRAVLDGAPIRVEAKVRGLPKAPEAAAELDLKDISLPQYLSYLPMDLPVRIDSGKVAVKGTASYRIDPEAGAEIGWDGAVTVTEIRVSDRGPLRLSVGGVLVRSKVSMGKKRGALVDDGTIEVREFSLPFGRRDGASFRLLSLTGLGFAEKENRVEVGGVLLEHARVRVSRDRFGVLSPDALVKDLRGMMPRGAPKAPAGPPIRWRIAKVEGKEIDVAFTDGTRKGAPVTSLSGLQFVATGLASSGSVPVPFRLATRWGKDTGIEVSGKAVPQPPAVDADVRIRDFPLADTAPYVPADAGFRVVGGFLDERASLSLVFRNDAVSGTYAGSTDIRDLKVLDRRGGPLLAWKNLSIDGVKATIPAQRVQVSKVVLDGLRAHVILEPDGTTNLPGSKKQEAGGVAKEGEGAKARPAAAKAAQKPKDELLQVDEIVVKDGSIDFTDRGVPGEFHATLSDVALRLAGVSTDPAKVADLRVSMKLPKGAPLRIDGTAAPLREPAFVDVDLVIDELDLTSVAPYSGTYLGLDVDRGSLTVKSRARVDRGTLAAENRIRVDQLKFGKAVKSDKATILPVRLIVDILRDKKGDIVLEVPVSAKTDDENLAGTVVRQAVKDVIFPPSSPLRSVSFGACSAELGPDAQARLRKLAAAMKDRPAMEIDAIGFVDRDVDGRACEALAAAPPAASAATPIATSAAPAAPLLHGDARMRQLAQGRAVAVREFLVQQETTDPARVAARTRDVYGVPVQKDDPQARVEFAPAGE
jgi:outer membrane protein OmpA-like peptidoglycan-associated protein